VHSSSIKLPVDDEFPALAPAKGKTQQSKKGKDSFGKKASDEFSLTAEQNLYLTMFTTSRSAREPDASASLSHNAHQKTQPNDSQSTSSTASKVKLSALVAAGEIASNWVDSGVVVAAEYAELRREARGRALVRNRMLEAATHAYLRFDLSRRVGHRRTYIYYLLSKLHVLLFSMCFMKFLKPFVVGRKILLVSCLKLAAIRTKP